MPKLRSFHRLTLAAAVALPAASFAEGELNLYSSRHYDTDDQLYTDFEELTGITINRIEGKGDELIARLGHKFYADDHGRIFHPVYALRLYWLQKQFADFGMVEKPLTQLFDQLTNAFNIGVIGDTQLKLHEHPITREIGKVANLAERYRVQRALVVAQLE